MNKSTDGFKITAEFHSHLGGSCSPDIMWQLAHEQGIRIGKEINTYQQFEHRLVKDKGYFDKYPLTQSIQSSPFAIEKAVFETFKHFKINFGIDHLELRFNPMLRNGHDRKFDLDVIIQRACDGFRAAKKLYDIDGGLIISSDRKFTKKQGDVLASKAIDFIGKGIIGFDVSGTGDVDIANYIGIYTKLEEAGIMRTFHAGEGLSLENQMELDWAVEALPLDRIGHGIACVKSEQLMKEIRNKGIILELCPMSNIKLGVLGEKETLKGVSYHDLIIEPLTRNGVRFNINMDGWLFLDCTPQENVDIMYQDLSTIDI